MRTRSYLVTVSVADHDVDLFDEKVPAAIRDRFDGTAVTVLHISEGTPLREE